MKPKMVLQSAGELQKKKFSKPLMERRRRARINDSLNELKVLVLLSLKKDPSRYSKMEKADILELTVKYLKAICVPEQVEDEDHKTHFLTGYNECAKDVQLYLLRSSDVSPHVKAQVLSQISATPSDPQRQSPPSSMEASPPMLSSPLIPSPVEHRSLVHTSLNGTGGKPGSLSTSSPKSAFSFSFPSPPASPIVQDQSNRAEIENIMYPPFSRQGMSLPPSSFVCRSSRKYSDGKCGLLGQLRSSHEERIPTDRPLKTIRPVTSSAKELWRPW